MDNKLRTLLMTAYGQATAFDMLGGEDDSLDTCKDQLRAAVATGRLLGTTILAIRNRILELDQQRNANNATN